MGPHKLVWHSLKKGLRVDLFDRSQDVLNRVDISEDRPDLVESLGAKMVPFLEADGIQAPPVSTWLEESRTPKRADKRWVKRMRRNGGTLPPSVPPPGDASSDVPAPTDETEQAD